MPGQILIVDDHAVTRAAVRTLLNSHSVPICGEASNGKEAIEKVIELRPDIVLLDVTMPVMDGITAAYEIRRISPATKIVFLTLYDSPAPGSSLRLWCHGFISKSEAGTKLIPTLNDLMEGDGANGHLRYPWQHLVDEAFRESNASLLPKRINAAERAISARLLDQTPTENHERIALKEALASLRKLVQETTPQDESGDKQNKEIA